MTTPVSSRPGFTRLSRNCSDWFPLLDVCAYQGCLIADGEGVYDPASANGRLLLGLKGQISEMELHTIQLRLRAGLLNKARRGDLALRLPVGLRRTEDGQVVKDPHQEVQSRIALVFNTFLRFRSAGKTMRFFHQQKLTLPRRDRFGNLIWRKASVRSILDILKNPAYCGKTYAFTRTYGKPKNRMKQSTKRKNTGIIWKPKEEWIEIPNATPAIISEEIFNATQERLDHNRRMATRSSKHEYLLRGHIYCAKCGRAFWAAPGIKTRRGKKYEYPFYQCSGKLKSVTPVRCDNKRHSTRRIEDIVWAEVERILSKPELIFTELERRKKKDNPDTWNTELERVNTLLTNRQKQKDRIHKAFHITGDEQAFRRDIAAITKELEGLEKEQVRLEECLASSSKERIDLTKLKPACKIVKNNLKTLSFDEKRFALGVLQLRVIVDDDTITLQGAIPLPVGQVVPTAS